MPEHTTARANAQRLPRTAETITAFLRLVVILGASLLLTSLAGAAVYAAPITLPLLFLIATASQKTAWRVAATIVAALTFLEIAWMLTWALWRSPAGSLAIAVAAALAFSLAFWNAAGAPKSIDA